MKLTPTQIHTFRENIYPYYHEKARDLPWRKTDDPYAILVSEIMLQQTQVGRVIEKYKNWIRKFPTHFDLARADMATILPYWVGLGYNRRALYLHKIAVEIVTHYHGIFPTSHVVLQKLPGVGEYTAKAICVYAFNQPLVLIETNVRTVYIHHFFPNSSSVYDAQLIPLIEVTMDKDNPCRWFNALMDYGTELKSQYPNPSKRSAHHVEQTPLKGSVREVRGFVISYLSTHQSIHRNHIFDTFPNDHVRVEKALLGLVKDHLVVEDGGIYSLNNSG